MIISHQKGRGKKIHLLLDETYQITTDVDFWAEHYIKDGTEIDEEEWQALVHAINYRKAVNKCFDLLSRRDHSVKELKTKLLRSVDPESADAAIDRMLELGYLDDEKYAKALLHHLTENKNMSAAFIRQEMFRRGVPGEIVTALLSETEIDNVAAIEELIVKKYRTKLLAENGREKVIAALMRKGFSYSDIREAFRNLEEEYEL
ncbi:MAG: regulatory protein RecX [Eubacterium sp.]|nr:regulatory protein RecX [Eubacterium sp.]